MAVFALVFVPAAVALCAGAITFTRRMGWT
jgi:hypothetical protein